MAQTPSEALLLLLDACLGKPCLRNVDALDTRKLYALAVHHQVRPVLLSYLKAQDRLPALQDKLRTDCQRIAFANLAAAKELVDVSKILKQNGVEVYAYKGSAWADWLYGDISRREFGDIDVLIPESDFSRAYDVLMNQCDYVADEYRLFLLQNPKTRKSFFRTDYHIPMLSHPGKPMQTVLEAHWRVAYPRLAFEFPSEEWAQYREAYPFLGSSINSFQREYQLLMLLVHHGGKEEWRKVKYVADLAAFMQRHGSATDWHLVSEMARQKGIFALLVQSMGLLRALGMEWKKEWPAFGTTLLPQHYLQNWELQKKDPTNSTWPYFKHGLSVHDGLRHRARLIMAHLEYFSEFQLIWSKFRYRQRVAKQATPQ